MNDRKPAAGAAIAYPLGRSERETRRLILQHQVYGPITRRFFEGAGIGPGMKVLELGSGAGDVAMLAADLVGPHGRVIGVDQNADILETARERARVAGWTNVTFIAGDVRDAVTERDFDAVVGRWVLMYVPEPAALLRDLATRLRPGGIVAFHENDFTYPPGVLPATELSANVQRWSIPKPGTPSRANMRTGTSLLRIYLEAGLPTPELRVEAAVGGGSDWPGYELMAETMRSLLPALEAMGVADPAEVDIDTLADRLREDVTRDHRVMMLPIMFGAWTRTRS